MTNHVRDDIQNSDAEGAALDMMRLTFAATNANLHDVIIRGIRAKAAPAKGGRVPKRKQGCLLAAEDALLHCKRKDAVSLWKYIQRICAKDTASFADFDLIFERKENRLYQYAKYGKSQSIGFRTFQRYVSYLKSITDRV